MSKSDFEWLLKTLSSSHIDFKLVYGLNFQIPEMIIIEDGEVKQWYYEHKGKILARPERYLKLRVAKEYFADPEGVKDTLDNGEYDFTKEKEQSAHDSPDQVLFCVYVENAAKNLRLVKKLRRKWADDLFRGNDFNDYFKSWTRVFSYIPQKDAGIFDVFVTKDCDNTNFRIKLYKKDFSLKDIEPIDYVKDRDKIPEHQRNISRGKDDRFLSQINYVCLASTIIEKLEKFSRAIMRFLESKSIYIIGQMHLEFIVDGAGQVWLVGCRSITFYNEEGELDPKIDKDTIMFEQTNFKLEPQCFGAYCRDDSKEENYFHEDGDEAVDIIQKNRKDVVTELPLKSILLDIVEKYKQFDRLRTHLSAFFSEEQIEWFVHCNPFLFRKYYSMGDIINQRPLEIHTTVHLYKKVKICGQCAYAYGKLDGYRSNLILKSENNKFDPNQAKVIVEKFLEDNPRTSGKKKLLERGREKLSEKELDLVKQMTRERLRQTIKEKFRNTLKEKEQEKLREPSRERSKEKEEKEKMKKQRDIEKDKKAKDKELEQKKKMKLNIQMKISMKKDKDKGKKEGEKDSHLTDDSSGIKKIFSETFYDKLQDFGKDALERMGLTKETAVVENFFGGGSPRSTLLPTTRVQTTSRYLRTENDVGGFTPGGAFTPGGGLNRSKSSISYLPKVQKEFIRDSNGLVKIKTVKVVDSRARNEVFGYKQFLGHIDYLPKAKLGFSLTKSSFKLNKLQDQLLYLNNVADRLQTAADADPAQEELDLIMCPYYGNGKKDTKRLDAFMTERRGKKVMLPNLDQSRSHANRTPLINVIADTSDFIEQSGPPSRKRSVFQRESSHKSLADSHNMLSQSIIGKIEAQQYNIPTQSILEKLQNDRPGTANSVQSNDSHREIEGKGREKKSQFANINQ